MDMTLRAVAESVSDGVVTADWFGNVTYVNKGAERLFGWPADEIIGQHATILTPERFRDAHRRTIQTDSLHVGTATDGVIELTALHKDGHEFPVELSLARHNSADGPRFTAIIRDITHHKRFETDLLNLNAQLEAANNELEAFSYSVSHDLRAPLRSIDGFSELLLRECADQLNEDGRDYLTRVRAACQRMSTLIDAMIGLSKVGREDLWSHTVDMTALAESVRSDLERSDQDRHVQFVLASSVAAVGDSTLLRVVLENLLANAWKFTSKRRDACIEFGVLDQHGVQTYFVRDNGAGFDPAYASRLFGAFQRLHPAKDFPGTGIGLPTVQRIVHRHGGKVWAEAIVGQGATFYFTLSPSSGAAQSTRASA